MLTKSDLNHIGEVIETKVTTIIDQRVPAIIEKKLKPIEKRLKKIEKTINTDFDYLDRLHIKSAKAINNLESRAGLPQTPLMSPR